MCPKGKVIEDRPHNVEMSASPAVDINAAGEMVMQARNCYGLMCNSPRV
jgi:hypothetical protein